MTYRHELPADLYHQRAALAERVQSFPLQSPEKIVLTPRQQQLLQLLRDNKGLTPSDLWEALGISRQAAMKLMRPLLDAGIIEKVGTKKSGRYTLKNS